MHVKLTIDQKNLLEAFLKQRRKRIVRNIKKKDTSDVEYAELTENERTEFTKYRKRKRRKFSKCFSTLLEKLKIEFVDKPELTNTDLVFLITLLKYGNNVPIHIFIKNLASETLHFNSFLSNTTVPGIYIPTTTTTTTTTIPMMKMDIKKEEEDADPLLQMTESEEISIRMNNPRLSTEELLVMEKQYQEALYRERIEDLAKQKILEEKDAYSLFIKEISQLQNSVFIESAIRLNQLGLIKCHMRRHPLTSIDASKEKQEIKFVSEEEIEITPEEEHEIKIAAEMFCCIFSTCFHNEANKLDNTVSIELNQKPIETFTLSSMAKLQNLLDQVKQLNEKTDEQSVQNRERLLGRMQQRLKRLMTNETKKLQLFFPKDEEPTVPTNASFYATTSSTTTSIFQRLGTPTMSNLNSYLDMQQFDKETLHSGESTPQLSIVEEEQTPPQLYSEELYSEESTPQLSIVEEEQTPPQSNPPDINHWTASADGWADFIITYPRPGCN